MVRQKSRKTVEELYAAAPAPPTLTTTRFDENFFQNSKNNKTNKPSDKSDLCNNSATTCRKKIKGNMVVVNGGGGGGAEKKDEKTFINEERLLGKTNQKSKKQDPFISSSLDNKNLIGFADETEKDEDTEEFFELIKETVENAVGKTLSDILNRNFREVSSKIDELREQLHSNEVKLEKIQADINNKIVHYGEENSRHFRYLCMKSEYDKMFYQHQNIMTAIPVDARPNIMNPYPQQFAQQGHPGPPVHLAAQNQQQQQQQMQHNPTPQQSQIPTSAYSSRPPKTPTVHSNVVNSQCNCHNSGCGDYGSVDRSKSSVSTKSSEMGIKEVKELLEQLQKFYEQQQSSDKDGRKDVRGDISLNIQDDSGDGDEDDSSDEMSSPSIEEKLGAGGDS